MPVPRVYILHPREDRLPGILGWLAEAEGCALKQPEWDGCRFVRIEYDAKASFDVPTISDRIRREPGPVILIQKVQHKTRSRLEAIVGRVADVTCAAIADGTEAWGLIEAARQGYEDGQPHIPLLEMLAYKIVRKLATMDMWGGLSKNKDFLWEEDLPSGGFPSQWADRRQILDVADVLRREGVLNVKTSQGQSKYALGDKKMVQAILDTKAFKGVPSLRAFFERNPIRVSVRYLEPS